MDVRRGVQLKSIFLQFFISMMVVFILAGLINILISIGIVFSGALRAANYSEKQIYNMYEKLQNEEIHEEMMPANVQYVLFDSQYNIIKSSMASTDEERTKKFLKGRIKNIGYNFFVHITRDDGFISLRYQYVVRYRSEWMNKNLPRPFYIAIVLFLLECIVGFIIVASWFSKKIECEMEGVIYAAEKIEQGELDFECSISNIREVNQVMDSIEKMKMGLKESLKKQWDIQYKKHEEIGALVHDIKTPITVIRGNAELLQETDITAEQWEYSDYIIESTKEIQKYIDVLIKTTNEEKCTNHIREKISTKELAVDIENSARRIAGKSTRVIFENKVAEDYIIGDKERLIRAVKNILINSVQHSQRKQDESYIEIIMEEQCGFISIIIEDNGKGFSNRDIEMGMDKFYMSDESRGSKENYGMGLYIVKSIIEDHKGEVLLKNSSQGGVVTLKIPKAENL